jgi:hypothetical protein
MVWTAAFAAILLLLSLAYHAPLLDEFAVAIPSDLGDPVLNTWILWWNAHHLPLTADYWNAPAFAPAPYALALSETLLGLTWLTTPLQWLGASPLVAYNVLFVAMPVLNGMSAYWLCLTLTRQREAAALGALAYAFAPYHASQLAHIQTQAMFWMPAALAGLHRYWSEGHVRWLALFGMAFALNGLSCGYFLLYFGVFVGIVIVWLALSSWRLDRFLAVCGTIALAGVVLAPVVLTYRSVKQAWDLRRPMTEIESFSADVLTLFIGSDRLLLWPIHAQRWQPEGSIYPQYPGVALALLLAAGVVVTWRARRPSVGHSTWRTRTRVILAAAASLALVAGVASWLFGPYSVSVGPVRVSVSHAYKPIGLALNLLLVIAVLSPGLARLVRAGSLAGLYAVGAAASSLLALGPLGRILGVRFWYKPPFAWLIALPGFDSVRVPALFSAITVLCLSVLAAMVVVRLLPRPTRGSRAAVAALAALVVVDGWTVMPVVTAPRPLPFALSSELVIELPSNGVFDDVAAMYRGMSHGRRVMNGYSGYPAPHYGLLQYDLNRFCFDSLDTARGGRSLDIVIWRHTPEAPRIDEAVRQRWTDATRSEPEGAIVYHVPASGQPPAGSSDPRIALEPLCRAVRPSTESERPIR